MVVVFSDFPAQSLRTQLDISLPPPPPPPPTSLSVTSIKLLIYLIIYRERNGKNRSLLKGHTQPDKRKPLKAHIQPGKTKPFDETHYT